VFLEQLETFPKAKHDDGPDGLEMAVNAAKNADSVLTEHIMMPMIGGLSIRR
jgi:phage terminase large subunit-like protein